MKYLTLTTALIVGLICSTAHAAFGVSVSGKAIQLIAPAKAGPGDLVANNYEVWYEGTRTLDTDLKVDLTNQTGSFEVKDILPTDGGTIQAGKTVDSYVAHLDICRECKILCRKFGKNGIMDKLLTATLTFDKPILGLALFSGTLDESDYLGMDTLYPTGNDKRGLGAKGLGDFFTVSADGKTLTLDWSVMNKDFDQMRIFTGTGGFSGGGNGVPEPTSLAIWGVGLLIPAVRWSRRSRGLTS